MRKEIPIAILTLTSALIYILGMAFWDDMPKDVPYLNNMYYLTTASVLYLMSVIINIITNSQVVKIASYIAMGIFSVNLYVELFLDPTNWSVWDLGLLVIVPLNITIMAVIIEKIKNKRK